jgi:endoglucanase
MAKFCFIIFLSLLSTYCFPQHRSEKILINQRGYYPNAPKIAVISDHKADIFFITSPDLTDTIYTGITAGPKSAGYSPAETWLADFSELNISGMYVMTVPGLGYSWPFEISPSIHSELAHSSLKSYYFQRMSTPLPYEFAGPWSRPAGHPDTGVKVHASAATVSRPEGTLISAPKGWYDAGDYNKYVVNSGITMGTLFSAWEDFPAYYSEMDINIPESGKVLPDILSELLWNLRWMIKMQDPDDGGVYHKLTTARFEGRLMPAEAVNQRYVVQKSTAAALNFTAVMAQASRIYKEFEGEVPGLADSCLRAAEYAWEWALKNPEIYYRQNEMNELFDPDIETGAYGDGNVTDEFIWAATELFITTKEEGYYRSVNILPDELMPVPAWNQVRLLAYYSLIRHDSNLPHFASGTVEIIKIRLTRFADILIENLGDQPYHTVMGKTAGDFIWGSNSVAANQGIVLVNAYFITGEIRYIDGALHNLDYLAGRNATGYSFITGYGFRTPVFIHHRPSDADPLPDPVPGLLAGGPNPGQQDGCEYPSNIPNESYTDTWCSYASNEIAINWNAPLVYLSGAIESLQNDVGYSGEPGER